MIYVDKQSRTPIYEQIIDQVERLILVGSLKTNMLIPSVRTLSIELSINPNTIQKAYNDLERRLITYSVPGVGRYVSADALNILNNLDTDKLRIIHEAVYELALTNLSEEIIHETVRSAFSEARINKEKRDKND